MKSTKAKERFGAWAMLKFPVQLPCLLDVVQYVDIPAPWLEQRHTYLTWHHIHLFDIIRLLLISQHVNRCSQKGVTGQVIMKPTVLQLGRTRGTVLAEMKLSEERLI